MSFKHVTRRDALRLATAFGAANYWHTPLWLNACAPAASGSQPLDRSPPSAAGSSAAGAVAASPPRTSRAGRAGEPPSSSRPGGGSDASAADGGAELAMSEDDAGSSLAAPDSVEWNENTSWWMQNEYAPVSDERESSALEVIGAIPPELEGLYLRNGPNPKFGDPGHWFLGHGMVHGVRLGGGEALWYKNRYVRTPLIEAAPRAGLLSNVPDPEAPTCNVNLVHHASRLLALGEQGYPFELSTADLSTLGKYDFAGKLTSAFTAHPKIDPVSGEMFAFAYTMELPYLRYYRIDRDGVLVQTEDIDLPLRPDGVGSKVTMMHDFQVSASKVVFMHLPIVLDVAAALAGDKLPFYWDAENGSHLGIMPRDGSSADVVWIEIEPCYIFHTLNAYDDANGKVILDVVRTPPPLWAGDNTGFSPSGSLARFTLDPAARTAKLEALDDRLIQFPQVDRRVASRRHRCGYALEYRETDKKFVERVPALVKYDMQRDSVSIHEFEASLRPDEAFFIPAGPGEDAGYLAMYVYDRSTDRTSLWILDASNLSAPPIAQVRLPFRVPVGFHGLWVPT